MIKTALLINNEIKDLEPQMSWPPKEDDLKPSEAKDYIPYLLDVFFTVLISGKSLDSESSRTEKTMRLKESFGQDIVFYCYEWGCANSKKRVVSFCCKGPV